MLALLAPALYKGGFAGLDRKRFALDGLLGVSETLTYIAADCCPFVVTAWRNTQQRQAATAAYRLTLCTAVDNGTSVRHAGGVEHIDLSDNPAGPDLAAALANAAAAASDPPPPPPLPPPTEGSSAPPAADPEPPAGPTGPATFVLADANLGPEGMQVGGKPGRAGAGCTTWVPRTSGCVTRRRRSEGGMHTSTVPRLCHFIVRQAFTHCTYRQLRLLGNLPVGACLCLMRNCNNCTVPAVCANSEGVCSAPCALLCSRCPNITPASLPHFPAAPHPRRLPFSAAVRRAAAVRWSGGAAAAAQRRGAGGRGGAGARAGGWRPQPAQRPGHPRPVGWVVRRRPAPATFEDSISHGVELGQHDVASCGASLICALLAAHNPRTQTLLLGLSSPLTTPPGNYIPSDGVVM